VKVKKALVRSVGTAGGHVGGQQQDAGSVERR